MSGALRGERVVPGAILRLRDRPVDNGRSVLAAILVEVLR
jgi:hypothetical protein